MNLISEKLFNSQLEVHVKLLTGKHSKIHEPHVGLKDLKLQLRLHFVGNISECRTVLQTNCRNYSYNT